MKKFYLLITVVVMSIAVMSCGKDDDESQPQTGIVGRWQKQSEHEHRVNGQIEYSQSISYMTFNEDGSCTKEGSDGTTFKYDKYTVEEYDSIKHPPRSHCSKHIKDYPLFLTLYYHDTIPLNSYYMKVVDNDVMFLHEYFDPEVMLFTSPRTYRLMRCK